MTNRALEHSPPFLSEDFLVGIIGSVPFTAQNQMVGGKMNNSSLRIQICPKKGITPTILFFSDGIKTINPIRSGGVWILRDLRVCLTWIV